ncbi:MAG: TetR/AcrR family transcriptional regulator [Chloroflexota bacterium]|nr:TetR/AcrR family transcriptional regulator [Chloroflexota bacterium]
MQAETNRHTRRKQRTQAIIKQATLALLLERGYDAFSVGDIAKHADLGRGTFYTHYKDKDEVVWDVIRESFKNYENARIPDLPGCPCGVETPYCFWLRIFWRADRNRDLYRLLLTSQGSATITSWIQNYLAALIDDYYSELFPHTEAVPRAYTVQFVTGALVRLLLWWLETPNDMSHEAMTQHFDRLVQHIGQISTQSPG